MVLTRLDVQLKQPLTQLSAWSSIHGTQKLSFVFKEGRSNWREWGLNSSCDRVRWAHTAKRVGDVLHTFDGAVLPCVVRALEHYLFHDPAQGLVTRVPLPQPAQLSRLMPTRPCVHEANVPRLSVQHYLLSSALHFFPASDVGTGCRLNARAQGSRLRFVVRPRPMSATITSLVLRLSRARLLRLRPAEGPAQPSLRHHPAQSALQQLHLPRSDRIRVRGRARSILLPEREILLPNIAETLPRKVS